MTLPGSERSTMVLGRIDHEGRAFWTDLLWRADRRHQRDGALTLTLVLAGADPRLMEHAVGGTVLVDDNGDAAGWAAPWALAGRVIDVHGWEAVIAGGAVKAYRHWFVPRAAVIDYIVDGDRPTISVRVDRADDVKLYDEAELPTWRYGPERVAP